MTKVSVIIKALNEEANIARAVESALRSVAPFDGEVIVADSVSKDRTVEIASRYPIKVVQLENPDERCCGIAPQLGYQHSTGEYVYILDGDMELDPEFLKTAIELLDREPDVAGVGGFIPEMRAMNLQFKGRMKRVAQQRVKEARDIKCLSGGGLYRRSSIESVGYISNRNLVAYEEYDLGTRLRVNGWRLRMLPIRAADHYSYTLSTLRLMWLKLRAGFYVSEGQIVRAAYQNGYLDRIFGDIFALRLTAAVWLYWLVVLLALVVVPYRLAVVGFALAGVAGMIALIAIRHGSLASGINSVVNWHLLAVIGVAGLFGRWRSPTERIASRIIKDGTTGMAANDPVAAQQPSAG
jgi:glycosyltransferase involved in cell wall biosynthesis